MNIKNPVFNTVNMKNHMINIFNILLDETTHWKTKIDLLNKLINTSLLWGHIKTKDQLLTFIFTIKDMYNKRYNDDNYKITNINIIIHKITNQPLNIIKI